uniref:Phosphoprotein n=1 Tax=Mus rat paramyxovirus TaxID=3141895 RepID=A0AAU7E3E1_9MONO
MANIDPQLTLIENGIQTVQFIQDHRDEIQKTYGRSTIEKPSTRERASAWEAYLESKAGDAPRPRRRREGKEDSNEASSKESNRDSGQGVSDNAVSSTEDIKPSNNGDNEGGDGSDPSGINSGAGQDSGREGNGADRGGSAVSEGADGAEGGDPADEIPDSDYARISLLDQATEDHMAGKEVGGKLEVREANPTDIAQILQEEASKTHRRLRGIRNLSKSSESEDGEVSPVKKGIVGNTVSMSSRGRHTSGSGAIPHARQLQSTPPSRSASAEDARKPARTARETSSDDELGSFAPGGGNDDVLDKLDRILENQSYIMQKLNLLSEMNEEIKGIKKILTNHGLSLSTIESYINDLMIVIPKAGLGPDNTGDEKNPDLRMVVGRDRNRGLPEIQRMRRQAVPFGEELGGKIEVDPQYLQEKLDFKKNNAANFVPEDGPISRSIIITLIKKRVKDSDTQHELIELIDTMSTELSMKEMYYQIREIISRLDDGNQS